jgi:hypothetical protein
VVQRGRHGVLDCRQPPDFPSLNPDPAPTAGAFFIWAGLPERMRPLGRTMTTFPATNAPRGVRPARGQSPFIRTLRKSCGQSHGWQRFCCPIPALRKCCPLKPPVSTVLRPSNPAVRKSFPLEPQVSRVLRPSIPAVRKSCPLKPQVSRVLRPSIPAVRKSCPLKPQVSRVLRPSNPAVRKSCPLKPQVSRVLRPSNPAVRKSYASTHLASR